ncbi:MAG TPA: helix-turn-helix transcriptional regulator [Streptosporangiaceae bacterium]|nr:helix-turn-helix transcriptional regulator [Streptosporangiaceae bacterium]
MDTALTTFTRSGAVLWAAQAQAEIARLGLRANQPHDLTPSERQVADLAAQGLTNREVARALFVSAKTVDATLSRIYRKLGVRSRTELAWRHGTTKASAARGTVQRDAPRAIAVAAGPGDLPDIEHNDDP